MTEKIIINAENAGLGRMASYAAKQALLGKEIVIINCEKVVVSGNEKEIIGRYKIKRMRGGSGLKGPNISATAEKLVKRTIRGMLSYKQERGRDALKRIRCYDCIPKEYEGKESMKMKNKIGISIKKIAGLLKGE